MHKRTRKSFSLALTLVAPLAIITACAEQGEPMLPTAISLESEVIEQTEAPELPQVANKPFLETVVGHWKGSCDIIQPGSPDVIYEVEMERIVEPTEDPSRYTWQIIYRTPDSEQLRDYTLVVVDEERGHYQVDENNGIVIDMYYYTNGILAQNFDVGNIRIIGHETYKGRKLNLQLLAGGLTPATTSGTADFEVNAYPFFSNQYCNLRKKRNRRR